MDFYRLAIGILCVWRITHLLQAEDGPWDIMVRFREAVGDGFVGRLLDCFACSSLWVSAPFAFFLAHGWRHSFLLWLSFSAGAILLERVTTRGQGPPPATYFERSE
ncbi:MAG TPA: hypothetical protein VGW36_09055 [Pyrinomonadaceae bacterium]|nr:hypothetical protein [Pyrinomonadaceae bacterium]